MKSFPPLLEFCEAVLVRNGQTILDHLTLEIPQGSHTAIIGPNGSGKSSLIKLITRQAYPLANPSGVPPLRLFGESRWDIFELRRQMGIVSADLHAEFTGFGGLTAEETALSGFYAGIGLAPHHHPTAQMRRDAARALETMEAAHLANRLIETLSTGEARRVLIARALVQQPSALLLDEPTTGLDLVSREHFLQTLRGLATAERTLILATHHAEEIIPEIKTVALLKQGRVYYHGPTEQAMTSERLTGLFDHPIEVSRIGQQLQARAI